MAEQLVCRDQQASVIRREISPATSPGMYPVRAREIVVFLMNRNKKATGLHRWLF